MGTKLEGKVALVTGGASGIGRASAVGLAGEGAAVAVLDRDGPGADETVHLIAAAGGRAVVRTVEVGDTASLGEVVDGVVAELGRLDILVNSAGITGDGSSLLDMDEANWDLVQLVNVKAPFVLLQHAARHMIAQGDGGRIVNLSSSSAFRAVGSNTAYGASKAAIVQLSRSAAAELGRYDINVNAVAPGLTRSAMTTPLFDGEDGFDRAVTRGPVANLFRRVSEPDDVAAAVVFLCLPESRQITAQTIHTSVGAVIV